MWDVPHHCRLSGIVGMHYFSQVSWPVSFFIFSQLPNHPQNGLMRPFHQPICLGVIRHGSQLPHTKEFTHLINNAAHKVHTSIAQEPGWGPRDQDVTLIQELGDCLSGLVGGHICHYMFCEMVLEHQDISDLRQSIQLQGCLYASKSTCKRSIGAMATIGCRGTLDKSPSCCKHHMQDLIDCCI